MKKNHLAAYMSLFTPRYLFLVVTFLVYSVLDLSKFFLLGSMVDLFTDVTGNIRKIYFGIILVSFCACLTYLFDVILPCIKNKMIENKMKGLRIAIGDKLLRIPYEEIEQMDCGDILSRTMGDMDRIQLFYEKDLSDFIILFFKGVLGGGICLFISWKFAAAFFFTVPVILVLSTISGKVEGRLQRQHKLEAADANEFALDVMEHMAIVKTFSLSNVFCRKYEEKCVMVGQIEQRIAFTRAAFSFINAISQLLPTIVMMIVGSILVSAGELTVGKFTIMLTMSSRVANLLGGIQKYIYSYQGYLASANRLMDLLGKADEKRNLAIAGKMSDKQVHFHHVSFQRNDKVILNHVDFNIKKGEHVAFVGKSGCGKTTLIKLLLAFNYCDGGIITLNGIEGIKGNQQFIRNQIAAVLQNNFLFPISIRENLELFSGHCEEEELITVMRGADIYDFIQTLPKGIDTVLGHGGINLSGGQKQRICIARACLKKSSILILDEPTASMDTKTESAVIGFLEKEMQGKTMISIAHRLPTIRKADRIYYMEAGKIVEYGTYEELCDIKGAFHQMYLKEIADGRHTYE